MVLAGKGDLPLTPLATGMRPTVVCKDVHKSGYLSYMNQIFLVILKKIKNLLFHCCSAKVCAKLSQNCF